MSRITILILALVSIFACKNDKSNASLSKEELLISAIDDYKAKSTAETYSNLMTQYGSAIIKETNLSKKESLLVEAIKVNETEAKPEMAIVFGSELIKLNPTHPKSKEYLLTLADKMKASGKQDLANIMYAGYINNFGKAGDNKVIADSLPAWTNDIAGFMKAADKKMFSNPGSQGYNTESSLHFVDLCEAYGLAFPKRAETPDYLFKAADVSRTMADFAKSISLYDWMVNYYPSHKNGSMSLFLKGFTIENEFKKYDLAKASYESFLQKYPNDPLAKDVKILLQNLGKSDKEVVEGFDKKK